MSPIMETPITTNIYYKSGYKYQLAVTYIMQTGIVPEHDIHTEYISLYTSGLIIIRKGYAWDGPSGPTVDTKNFMRGSLEHDALYQLMRMELLPQNYRIQADKRLKVVCLEDGMSTIRAQWVYLGVRSPFAASAARPSSRKKVIKAP